MKPNKGRINQVLWQILVITFKQSPYIFYPNSKIAQIHWQIYSENTVRCIQTQQTHFTNHCCHVVRSGHLRPRPPDHPPMLGHGRVRLAAAVLCVRLLEPVHAAVPHAAWNSSFNWQSGTFGPTPTTIDKFCRQRIKASLLFYSGLLLCLPKRASLFDCHGCNLLKLAHI